MLGKIHNSIRVFKLFFGLNPKIRILNEIKESTGFSSSTDETSALSAVEIAIALQKLILSLKGKFLSEDGRTVNYDALRESDEYQTFESEVQKLCFVNLDNLSEIDRKAFFLNIYNVLTIHGLASINPLPDLVTEVSEFWRSTAYQIGEYIYTLDEMEHGILRANKPHPASVFPIFDRNDPRLKYAMQVLDARIHFALNCGAKSCPAVRVYSAEILDKALDMAARNFCSQDVELDEAKHKLRLSQIFSWYKSDFGDSETDLLRFVAQFLPSESSQLQNWLADEKVRISVEFKDYDWSINKS